MGVSGSDAILHTVYTCIAEVTFCIRATISTAKLPMASGLRSGKVRAAAARCGGVELLPEVDRHRGRQANGSGSHTAPMYLTLLVTIYDYQCNRRAFSSSEKEHSAVYYTLSEYNMKDPLAGNDY